MNLSDKQRFVDFIQKIISAYPNCKLGKEAIDIYFDKFINFSFESIEAAFNELILKCKYFPTIAEVMAVMLNPEMGALAAWLPVENALRQGWWKYNLSFGNLITHAVVLSFGDFYAMSKRTEPLHFLEKEFCKRYDFYKTKNLADVPWALYARNPICKEIFDLSFDGISRLKEFFLEQKKLDLISLKQRLSELDDKERNNICLSAYDCHQLKLTRLSIDEKIIKLTEEIEKEGKCKQIGAFEKSFVEIG